MAFAEAALAALLSKAGAVAAGTALAVGGVGVAATGNLPPEIQGHVDALLSTERGAPETVEVVQLEEERGAEANENAGDNGKGEAVSKAAREAGEGLEGRERGQAISKAVRVANGSAGKGQGEARRAAAQERAAARGGNADAASDAGEAEERREEAATRAETGRDNAETDVDVDAGEIEADEDGDEFDAGPPADAGAAGNAASERRATPGDDS